MGNNALLSPYFLVLVLNDLSIYIHMGYVQDRFSHYYKSYLFTYFSAQSLDMDSKSIATEQSSCSRAIAGKTYSHCR